MAKSPIIDEEKGTKNKAKIRGVELFYQVLHFSSTAEKASSRLKILQNA